MTSSADIVTCARQFIGVRFIHQGRSEAGLDCLGLLLTTAKAAGLVFEDRPADDLDVPNYTMRPDTALLKQRLDQLLAPIALETLAPGDVVLLKVHGSPQHLAILSDYPVPGHLGMIHAYAAARQVVEHRYDAAWQRETYAAYRLPHLA